MKVKEVKIFGTKLINFAIDRARELSCERVMLNNSMESISYKSKISIKIRLFTKR